MAYTVNEVRKNGPVSSKGTRSVVAWLTNSKNFQEIHKMLNWLEAHSKSNYLVVPLFLVSDLEKDECLAIEVWMDTYLLPFLKEKMKKLKAKRAVKIAVSTSIDSVTSFEVHFGPKKMSEREVKVFTDKDSAHSFFKSKSKTMNADFFEVVVSTETNKRHLGTTN